MKFTILKMLRDLASFKINVIWNTPYSPRFSSIEEIFGIEKSKLRS